MDSSEKIASKLLATWISRLEGFSEYPECVELLEIVRIANDWKVKSDIHEKIDCLYSVSANLGVCIPDEGDEVMKFKWAAVAYKLHSDEVGFSNSAGLILNLLSFGRLSKEGASNYFSDTSYSTGFPRSFMALQGNPYGTTLLGYNGKGVWMMDDSLEYQLIGSVDDFMRYCVRCVLDRKDWFQSFYWTEEGKELVKSYNLKVIRPFNEF